MKRTGESCNYQRPEPTGTKPCTDRISDGGVFPKHGVRYIALYDNVDTFAGDNEIAPFKNVLNEMYSRDISKKVHASYHLQATKGKFTGVVPPLGYQKDPEEKGHLLIDDETAPIVRKFPVGGGRSWD